MKNTAAVPAAASDQPRSHEWPSWPVFPDAAVDAACRVMRSGHVNYWTGSEGKAFEEEYATTVGRRYAVAVANGTVALELALYALDIGPGDEVVTTSRTFIASASCVIMRGATPVLADVDRDSQNITAATIRPQLTPRTKAIIAVHLAGWPCAMDEIRELAAARGIYVIEDCAQAHGARYRNRPVGSMSDIAAFSFCQDKILSTGGEGGMVVTDDPGLYERAWSFKDHGKALTARDPAPADSGFRWLHERFGTNWRLTEIQSAIGRVLLRTLPEQVAARRRHADLLNAAFSSLPALRTTVPGPDVFHSYYKYYVFLRPEKLRPDWTRDRIASAIRAEGVPCYSGSCSEIYLEAAFPEALRPAARLPAARDLGENSLMFLVHPTLSGDHMQHAVTATDKILAQATA